MKNKRGRYWVFAFSENSLNGGLDDYKFSFNTVEQFEDSIMEYLSFDTYQVLDTRNNHHYEGDIGTVTKWVCKIVDEIE